MSQDEFSGQLTSSPEFETYVKASGPGFLQPLNAPEKQMSGIDGQPLRGRELDFWAEGCERYLDLYKAYQESKEYGRRLEQKIRDKTPLPIPPLRGVSESAL